jgi:arsenate reductase (thioredoxin)
MRNVLVLCTGNSCRSIMAESLINHLGEDRYRAVSAGSFPAGYIHPESIDTLRRHGIVYSENRSKSWHEFENHDFDLIITVCDQAANEACPSFLGAAKKLHWSIPDPAKVEGNAAEVEAAFDAAYKLLRERIEEELL